MTHQNILRTTQNWLTSFIIAYNICPFAQREQQRNSIRYQISDTDNLEQALHDLMQECAYLDEHPATETTLLIFATGFKDFDDYLDLVAIAEHLLADQAYEGVYQLASFHPDYCFASDDNNNDQQDPANYTNRSPYPMLHIIREASIERALAHYPDPENIPTRNIKLTRELGLEKLQPLLADCTPSSKHQSTRDKGASNS